MAQAGVAQDRRASKQPMRSRTPQHAPAGRGKNQRGASGQSPVKHRTGSGGNSAPGAKRNLNGQPVRNPVRNNPSAGRGMSSGAAAGGRKTAPRPNGGVPKTGNGRSVPVRRNPPGHKPAKAPYGAPMSPQRKRQLELEYIRRRRAEIRRRERINGIMFGAVGCLIVIALFVYIGRMADVAAASKEIDRLRILIDDLREQKQYKEYELAAAQNMERVEGEALGRLGMITPSEEQVRYIHLSDYLK